ncbi:unnamed protein product, partial [Ceratitis capitata]
MSEINGKSCEGRPRSQSKITILSIDNARIEDRKLLHDSKLYSHVKPSYLETHEEESKFSDFE